MSEHAHDGHHGHAGHDHGHDAHEEHIHEVSHYVKVYAALLGLFMISVAGPILEIWWLTLITAFGIAVVKASMVVKFFMHLDLERRFVHYFLAVSLLFMFLFFFAVAPDVMNHRGTNWENVSAQHAVDVGMKALNEGGGGHGHGEAAPAEGHGAPGGGH